MPAQTLTALEFPGLLRVLQRYALSGLGRSFIMRLAPDADLGRIQTKFKQISELHDLENREGPVPLSDFPDLALWLTKAAAPGSLLPPEAFNDTLHVLRLARNLRHYLGLRGEAAPHLVALAARLKDIPPLLEEIQRCISPHHFILDQASPALAQVRKELADTRERVNRVIKQTFFQPAYQPALQNPTISQRHGRYVIPVKADHKGAIPGIIHDQSQTRATIFVEPLAIVEHNNALNLLANREKREEEAVLRRLTDLLRAYQDGLEGSLAALAELDAVQARVRFAQDFKAREPIWRSRPGLNFRQARHPLLWQRCLSNPAAAEVVPIDLSLGPEQRFLIISGANAGGKTVALKTLGLLTLMVQSGVPIPVAEGSEFCPFSQVFADIGDTQDLEQNLSTFSAHLKRALHLLENLPKQALILMDELGAATDPTEGGALALALLQAFDQRGAYGAVTTHIPLIKNFAAKSAGLVNVAVIFNEETRRPTYRLAYGVVGASNALKIARELGLSPEILALAERFLDQDELKAYRLLAQVEAAQQHLAHKEMELAKQRGALDQKERELEDFRARVEEERRRTVEELQGAARQRIKQAEAEFKEIVQRLRRGRESWGRLRQEFSQGQERLLKELTPAPAITPPPAPALKVGQKVLVPALGLTGKILATDTRDGRLEVQVRQVKLRVSPEEVVFSGAAAPDAAAGGSAYHVPPERQPRLNLVGLRVDEALPLVDRLLDQAMLHGQEQVDIVHGVGTGKLKAALWEHLKHHAAVQAILPDANPGVTVVEVKH
jgi:DNA mismatch repair protein MutS2